MNETATRKVGPRKVAADDTRGALPAGAGSTVRFLFDGGDDVLEALDVRARDAARDRLLEVGQVPVDPRGGAAAARGGRDHERPAIVGADRARDEAAIGEPIEDARQRRALVREAAVERRNRRRPGRREQREDVRFALGQGVVTQVREIEADPMGRPMNPRYEAQRQ